MLSFRKDNSASMNFILSAVIWLLIGVSFGLILAIEFVFPDFVRGTAWLVFGRLRQAHVNTVLFAWLSGGMMGLWLYIVPRLTGTQDLERGSRQHLHDRVEPGAGVRHRRFAPGLDAEP